MSVETYNPNANSPVAFTPTALKHLSTQVKNQKALGIEFKVKESGCSGYKYLLELASEVSKDAVIFQLENDLKLYIEPKVTPLINGTLVDYVQEGVNFRLEFTNPNATAHCGCGESFSVKEV